MIDHLILLHETAISALTGLRQCNKSKEQVGTSLFGFTYKDLMQDLKLLDDRGAIDGYLTDAQVDDVLNADMQVDATGKLISTPENE